ncbi:MAG TPA: hypothetical protein VMV29_08490 [Ktedonobacterales bacterium]|nr:hypothetical protein [Ktedonobacterales bacterium]
MMVEALGGTYGAKLVEREVEVHQVAFRASVRRSISSGVKTL